MGAHHKVDALEEYMDIYHIDAENILYMGDDIPDIPPMKLVALATCPQNAVAEVKIVWHNNESLAKAEDDTAAEIMLKKLSGDWHQVWRNKRRKCCNDICYRTIFTRPAADQDYHLSKANLENEIWNKIRINPADLPIGELTMIPSLEFIRLTHKELKEYKAITSITEDDGLKTYEIIYPDLERNFKN
ncbi:unnamed protein product [Bathycoccus prasinos]